MENTVEAKSQKEHLRVKVLHEIANDWNIEAKQESTDYFYSTGESQELLTGKKYFVIGRKQTFSPTEFVDMYESYVSTSRIQDRGAENILRILFEFSVIGNQPKAHKQPIFKYQTVRARFNFKENIMIHRGLYKALQIY